MGWEGATAWDAVARDVRRDAYHRDTCRDAYIRDTRRDAYHRDTYHRDALKKRCFLMDIIILYKINVYLCCIQILTP